MWRLLLLPALLLTACGDESEPPPSSTGTERASLPASYSYDLGSTCGERSLIGRYRVWVEGDEVTRAEPTGPARVPELDTVPTIADIERLLDDAEPDAVVEVERDDDGTLTWVSIDHIPEAIDDEECYSIANVTETETGPRVSCGGSGPGWPAAAMDGGIEPTTPRAEIETALEKTEQEMGIDGPFLGTREWIVLAEDDDLLTLGTGHWDAAGPGKDAMVVSYEHTDAGLEWAGHGQCLRLSPVLGGDQAWVQITAPPGGLDRAARDLTVLVMEHDCTGSRDPRPHLHEPTVVEDEEQVVVAWTISPPTGANSCPGNPAVEQVLHLDEPLGDRELLDGSTWPATPVEEPDVP